MSPKQSVSLMRVCYKSFQSVAAASGYGHPTYAVSGTVYMNIMSFRWSAENDQFDKSGPLVITQILEYLLRLSILLKA